MEISEVTRKLEGASLDHAVGMRHALVIGGRYAGLHVAEIPKQVNAHVHWDGDEICEIRSGEGLMHIGKAAFKGEKPIQVEWKPPVKVTSSDVFSIPEGYAHSLKNTGDRPLLITFICPHPHIATDRYFVENPP